MSWLSDKNAHTYLVLSHSLGVLNQPPVELIRTTMDHGFG